MAARHRSSITVMRYRKPQGEMRRSSCRRATRRDRRLVLPWHLSIASARPCPTVSSSSNVCDDRSLRNPANQDVESHPQPAPAGLPHDHERIISPLCFGSGLRFALKGAADIHFASPISILSRERFKPWKQRRHELEPFPPTCP